MTKSRGKWLNKLFDDESLTIVAPEKQTYFDNVVPPLNNQYYQNENLDSIIKFNKQQNTNSYIVAFDSNKLQQRSEPENCILPLSRTVSITSSFQKQPGIEFSTLNNQNIAKPNFKIPKPLSFEIKIVKLRQIMLCFLSLMVILLSSVFLSFYHTNRFLKQTPHPIILIPLLLFATIIFLFNLFDFFSLMHEINCYVKKSQQETAFVPNFIVRNYRKIHGSIIINNWLFGFCYFLFSICTLIMYLISNQKLTFLVQKWTITIPNLQKEIILLLTIMATLLVVHTIHIILFKIRKTNILSYYGYEIIPAQDIDNYKKKINRICIVIIIVLLLIIFSLIAIPIYLIRRKKRK